MWVDRLIREYRKGKKQLEAYRKTLDRSDPDQADESKIVSGMISDMQYSLTWMRRGKRPDSRRGIHRRSVYQRTVILDTELFPSLMIEPEPENELTEEQKRKLADVLWRLSDRERECYLLHMAYGLSWNEISEELGIKKATVQSYVDRAKEKILYYIKEQSNP